MFHNRSLEDVIIRGNVSWIPPSGNIADEVKVAFKFILHFFIFNNFINTILQTLSDKEFTALYLVTSYYFLFNITFMTSISGK